MCHCSICVAASSSSDIGVSAASSGTFPGASRDEFLHRPISEFGARTIAADHEHQDPLLVGVAFGNIFKTTGHAGRERDDIEGTDIDKFHFAFLVLPTTPPFTRHRYKGLVGIVVMHHRSVARFGATIA